MSPKLVILLGASATAFFTNKLCSTPQLSRSGFLTTLLLISIPISYWITWNVFLYPYYFSPLRDLPEPPHKSLLGGHARQMIGEPFGVSFRKWINEVPHDGLMRLLDFTNQEILFVISPAALAEVLVHKCYDFEKPFTFRRGSLRILGEGILVAEGDVHKAQRKNLMPAFTFRAIKNLYPLFWQKSKDLVQNIIRDHNPEVVSKQEFEVEVSSWTAKAALDIIGAAALNLDFRSLKDPNAELSGIYSRTFAPTRLGITLDIISMFIPPWVVELVPIKRHRDRKRAQKIIEASVYSQLSVSSQKSNTKVSSTTDLISVALESQHFTEPEIIGQMMTFLVAGHETTATAVTWAIYLLCKHPDTQTRLREELSTASIPHPADPDSSITAASIDSLPYLSAFCNETLRIYPPVAMTARETARDTTILNHVVPKGTVIALSPWSVNTAIALWGPDAAEFKPERWLGPGRANSGGAASNFAFLTFLHGPRSCIGKFDPVHLATMFFPLETSLTPRDTLGSAFARAEFMCLMAAWVMSFETRLCRPDDEIVMDVTGGISVKPKGGLLVKVRPLAKG